MNASRPILCYVTDSAQLRPAASLPEVMQRALRAGVDWIQIREKTMPVRQLLELARTAIGEPGRTTRILINDRLDVALAAAADGVHLGSASLPVREVLGWLRDAQERLSVGPGFLLGRSCHSLAEAQQAEEDGASYVIFGPVFSTPSKAEYGPPHGCGRLAEVCHAVRIPVLAIGGVSLSNAAECLRAGAAGIAAIRLFQDSRDLAETVSQLKAT